MSYFSTERFLAEMNDLDEQVEKALCPDCGGKGGYQEWPRGSKAPDPQTAVECPTCENQGVVDEDRDYADSHLSI